MKALKARALAHAYVTLDRLVFYELRQSSELQKYYAVARQYLQRQEAVKNNYLRPLRDAGAEDEELLWLLWGCEGLPGASTLFELFGWSPSNLARVLRAMESAQRGIEKMRYRPFGILIQLAEPFVALTGENLRLYSELVGAGKRDFRNSEWFLNIAKARLVQHVTHWTRDHEPHDPEVSGLIAAITGKDYNADTHKHWRNVHSHLVTDRMLDPYTIQTPEQRDQSIRMRHEMTQDPYTARILAKLTADFLKLSESRLKPRNRKSAKTRR